jgi:hypothetical protein
VVDGVHRRTTAVHLEAMRAASCSWGGRVSGGGGAAC